MLLASMQIKTLSPGRYDMAGPSISLPIPTLYKQAVASMMSMMIICQGNAPVHTA